jgi:aspartate 1-decarboxylase
MLRTFLQAKIHRATITDVHLDYEGSISICPLLLEQAGLLPCERVDVYNAANGERFSTYVITGRKGRIGLNGAAAHKGNPGDLIIIAAYALLEASELEDHLPRLVYVNEQNEITSVKQQKIICPGSN